MSPLSANAIQEKLQALPAWKLTAGEIVREASFKDFPAAMEFVNHVAEKAESAGHHPDIDIRYNKVKLALVSHDAGGITEKDFDLAQAIDSILKVAAG
jgi:4a-hydroxytetrahydrobiopterin dehydratase